MKKMILLAFAMTIASVSFSQDVKAPNFLGENYLLYKNSIFHLDTSTKAWRWEESITNVGINSWKNKDLVPAFQGGEKAKDSLKGRNFLVSDILEEKDIENFESSNGIKRYTIRMAGKVIMKLTDTSNKEEFFYIYDPERESSFSFRHSNIMVNPMIFSDRFEKKFDEIENEDIFTSYSENVSIIKYFNKTTKKSTYYLRLSSYGSTPVVNGKGISLLFSDGTRWIKPAENVSISVDSDGYEYSTFSTLTPADLALFQTKSIKKYKLYIFETDLWEGESEFIKIDFKNVTKIK